MNCWKKFRKQKIRLYGYVSRPTAVFPLRTLVWTICLPTSMFLLLPQEKQVWLSLCRSYFRTVWKVIRGDFLYSLWQMPAAISSRNMKKRTGQATVWNSWVAYWFMNISTLRADDDSLIMTIWNWNTVRMLLSPIFSGMIPLLCVLLSSAVTERNPPVHVSGFWPMISFLIGLKVILNVGREPWNLRFFPVFRQRNILKTSIHRIFIDVLHTYQWKICSTIW